jgi:death-on-curing family protein
MEIKYLTVRELIEINKYVLKAFHDKKGDKHEILDMVKIIDVIYEVEEMKGDIYEKAAYLMFHIVRGHAFGSGNKRTGYSAMKEFMNMNDKTYKLKDDNIINPKIMIAIREGRYTLDEIREWIKYGRIKKNYER